MKRAAPHALVLAALLAAAPAFAQRATAPDPLAAMPGDISAVLDVSTAPRVLLIEEAYGVGNSRVLAAGDEYRSGWKIAAITPQSITLNKGAQQRTVQVPGRARTTTLAAAPATATSGAPANPLSALGAFGGGAGSGQARTFTGPPGGPGGVGGRGGGRGGRGGPGGPGGRGGFQMAIPPEIANMLNQPGMAAMIEQMGALPDGSRITMGEVDGRPAIIRLGPDGRPMDVMSTDGAVRLNMDPNGTVSRFPAPPGR